MAGTELQGPGRSLQQLLHFHSGILLLSRKKCGSAGISGAVLSLELLVGLIQVAEIETLSINSIINPLFSVFLGGFSVAFPEGSPPQRRSLLPGSGCRDLGWVLGSFCPCRGCWGGFGMGFGMGDVPELSLSLSLQFRCCSRALARPVTVAVFSRPEAQTAQVSWGDLGSSCS